MSIARRLARLEQTQTGDGGAGMLGVCRIDHATGTGPDAVWVAATGETLTAAAFHARYPHGLLLERVVYGAPYRPEHGPRRAGGARG